MWWWVVWLIVVTVLLIGVVLMALGRGDNLAEQDLDDVVVDLPEDRPVVASDVEVVRLPLALRGYQMTAVDNLLDRLAAELALRDSTIRELQANRTAPETAPLPADPTDESSA